MFPLEKGRILRRTSGNALSLIKQFVGLKNVTDLLSLPKFLINPYSIYTITILTQ